MVRFSNAQVAEAFQPCWAALQRGEFITDPAAQAGTYRKQGTRWVAASGGVRPRDLLAFGGRQAAAPEVAAATRSQSSCCKDRQDPPNGLRDASAAAVLLGGRRCLPTAVHLGPAACPRAKKTAAPLDDEGQQRRGESYDGGERVHQDADEVRPVEPTDLTVADALVEQPPSARGVCPQEGEGDSHAGHGGAGEDRGGAGVGPALAHVVAEDGGREGDDGDDEQQEHRLRKSGVRSTPAMCSKIAWWLI